MVGGVTLTPKTNNGQDIFTPNYNSRYQIEDNKSIFGQLPSNKRESFNSNIGGSFFKNRKISFNNQQK